jgi:glycerophosphoryl diester phosphodiesterase
MPAWIRNRPIAHRGLHDGMSVPENSMQAFERAVAASVPIELDVHLAADGQLAVFHDDDLERMTGERGKVWERTAAELSGLGLGGTDCTIPLLDEVLDLIAGSVPVLVEIKNVRQVGPLESALAETLSRWRCQCAVASFNPLCLRWFRLHARMVVRGQLAGDLRGSGARWHHRFLLSRYYLNFMSSPHFLAYDIRCLPNRRVEKEQRKRRIPLLAWTVRSPREREKAMRLADNFIFESPDLDLCRSPGSGRAPAHRVAV